MDAHRVRLLRLVGLELRHLRAEVRVGRHRLVEAGAQCLRDCEIDTIALTVISSRLPMVVVGASSDGVIDSAASTAAFCSSCSCRSSVSAASWALSARRSRSASSNADCNAERAASAAASCARSASMSCFNAPVIFSMSSADGAAAAGPSPAADSCDGDSANSSSSGSFLTTSVLTAAVDDDCSSCCLST